MVRGLTAYLLVVRTRNGSSPSATYDFAGNQKSLGGYTFTHDAEGECSLAS